MVFYNIGQEQRVITLFSALFWKFIQKIIRTSKLSVFSDNLALYMHFVTLVLLISAI